MAIAFGGLLGETHTTGAGTTKILTTTASVPSGGKILVSVQWFSATGTLSGNGISGGGLTWQIDKQQVNGSYRAAIVSADAPAGLASSTALTATWTASADTSFVSGEYITGAATGAASVDAVGGAGGTGTTATANVVTTNADDFIFQAMWVDFLLSGSTPAASMIEDYDVAHTDGEGMETAHRVVASTGTYAVGATWTGSAPWVLAGAAYKADTGGGGTPPGGRRRRIHPARAESIGPRTGRVTRRSGPYLSFYEHNYSYGATAASEDHPTSGLLAAGVVPLADVTHDATAVGILPAGVAPVAAVTHDSTATGLLPAGGVPLAPVGHDYPIVGHLPVGVTMPSTVAHNYPIVAHLPAAAVPMAPVAHDYPLSALLAAGVVPLAPVAHDATSSALLAAGVAPFAPVTHDSLFVVGDCGYVTFPSLNNNYLSSPDDPVLEVTKLTLVAKVRPTTWTPAAAKQIVTRTVGGNVFRFGLVAASGSLYLGTYDSGGTETTGFSTAYLAQSGVVDGEWLWLAASKDPNDGTNRVTRLYWSRDGASWTLFSTTTNTPTTINTTSTAPLQIGALNATTSWAGDIAYVSMRDGVGAGGTVGGTEVFRFDGSADLIGVAPTANTFTASTGQTVTVNHSGGTPTVIVPACPAGITAGIAPYATVSHDASVAALLAAGVVLISFNPTNDHPTTGLLIVAALPYADVTHDAPLAGFLPAGAVPMAPVLHSYPVTAHLAVGAVPMAPVSHDATPVGLLPVGVDARATAVTHNASIVGLLAAGAVPLAAVSHTVSTVGHLAAGATVYALISSITDIGTTGFAVAGATAAAGTVRKDSTPALILPVGAVPYAAVSHDATPVALLAIGVDARAGAYRKDTALTGLLAAGVAPYALVSHTAFTSGRLDVAAFAAAIAGHDIPTLGYLAVGVVPIGGIILHPSLGPIYTCDPHMVIRVDLVRITERIDALRLTSRTDPVRRSRRDDDIRQTGRADGVRRTRGKDC